MESKLGTQLEVNNQSMELNPFVAEFLTRIVVGAVSSLKGAESIQNLELQLEQGNVKLSVNGNELHLTPFPKEIITNTVMGLVSSLKGVDKIDSVKINLRAE